MDKASGLKENRCNGVLTVGRKRKCQSKKNPQKPHKQSDTIESFSNQICKASQLLIFDEFDICYGTANNVVKQDLKNSKDLNNICSEEVLGKDTNLFAEMQITTIKFSRTPRINVHPPLTF